MEQPNYRILDRDYMVTCRPALLADGRFQAQLVITAVGGLKTRTQRFIDLAIFDLHDDAVRCAERVGKKWVDDTMRADGR